MKIGVLNTSILTNDGQYTLETVSLEEARALVAGAELDSAVGHQSTADLLTSLLGVTVEVNRQEFSQQPGQLALVFKLNARGVKPDMTQAELLEKGYTLKKLVRVDFSPQISLTR